jgi:hypothetical protein
MRSLGNCDGLKLYLQARYFSLVAKSVADLPPNHLKDILTPHKNLPDFTRKVEEIAITIVLQYLEEHRMTCSLECAKTELGSVPRSRLNVARALEIPDGSLLSSLFDTWSQIDQFDQDQVKRTNFRALADSIRL